MRSEVGARRARSLALLLVAAAALLVLLPIWLPLLALFDLVTLRRRLPTARLVLFGLGWAWLELAAVAATAGTWLTLQGRNQTLHYRLQRWWATAVLNTIDRCVGLRLTIVGADKLGSGPLVVLSRHASLIDSLITAVVIARDGGMNPRMVMKRELMADPALDIVGHRLPNVFVDRGATDSTENLAALTALATGLGAPDAVAIFPEGTRASATRRTAALERIGSSNPARAERMSALRWLLPPRASGAAALLAAAPTADVVVTWHCGLDGLNTFQGIRRAINRGPLEVHYEIDRFDRAQVDETAVGEWLDEQWLRIDAEVDRHMAGLDAGR